MKLLNVWKSNKIIVYLLKFRGTQSTTSYLQKFDSCPFILNIFIIDLRKMAGLVRGKGEGVTYWNWPLTVCLNWIDVGLLYLLWFCFCNRGDRILCWATQPVIEFMPEVRGTLVFTILFISMLVWYFYSPPYILVFKDKKIFNLSSIIFVL